MEVQ
jgi:hypothetical protein